MNFKTKVRIFESICFAISIYLFFLADWKLAAGLIFYEINAGCTLLREVYLEER